ncbi:MAG: radical SAM/SPASM domain-containing protein [Planctomycetota bacterium]
MIFRRFHTLTSNLRFALRTQKSRLWLKLARNHALARLGIDVPRTLVVAVDYRCNLTCGHCSARTLDKKDAPPLTLDDYKRIGHEAKELGLFNIQFTGGEPLLRRDLEEVIQCFHPRENFIMISTHGMFLTRERLASLRKAGVDAFCISLDSMNSQEHDAFRRKEGVWEKAITGLRLARQMGFGVAAGCVITHQNVGSQTLEDIALFTHSIGADMLLNWACPVGAWEGNRDARLTDEDHEWLQEFQLRHSNVRTDFDGNYIKRGCPAGPEFMYLTAQGELLPCAFIPVSYGNVREAPLGELRSRILSDPAYGRYPPRCLSAGDDAFYESHIKPTFGLAPLSHSELLLRGQEKPSAIS